ncbi:MAG: IclR family transcriptional regulator [Burkholderiaceae bacterium]|nr:IclR family transcriptional regulator [Desulfobacterales bacterium]MDP3138284.1 IclR family transcriptional regulator [Burkholderiaceae bacterium]
MKKKPGSDTPTTTKTADDSDKAAAISSLDRAIDLLETFTEAQPELTLTEIVGKTGYHKATVFRLLTSLRHRLLLTKDDNTGKYRIGLRMLAFADIAKAGNNFVGQARRAMLELRDETRQTIYLSVRKGDYRYDIEQIQGLAETRLSISLGEPKLLEIGAAGRVMLACMKDEDVDGYFSRTRKQRLASTNVAAVKREVAEIRHQGYGESLGNGGMTAIAAPLWGVGNVPLGTVSMILALDVFKRDHGRMAAALVARVGALSQALGASVK